MSLLSLLSLRSISYGHTRIVRINHAIDVNVCACALLLFGDIYVHLS